MSAILKIHGHDWSIDTADWLNHADSERCQELIERNIFDLGPDVVNAVREDYLDAFHSGDYAFDEFLNSDAMRAIEDACSRAYSYVIADYYSEPQSGHNHFASPVPA